mmetsp:Transcript_83240/g.147388  ORF Transcript_83240/g.147388 Transcript_83240/m.147388 type:complete len:1620 (-) Transcript_83240:102-4961(-)
MSSLFRNSGAGAKAAPKPDPKATFKSSLAGRLPTADAGSTNMAGAAVRTKSPVKFSQPPGATPAKLGKKDEPSSPGQEDVQKVNAWQAEMDTLEQTQMQIQNDQMNLLHSQIHILMRELGDLQKHVVALTQKVDEDGADLLGKMEEMKTEIKDAAEEAHAAIRLELAEHGNNAEELKAAMEEAHGALSKAMEDGLNNMSEQTSRDLANHAEAHGATVAELEAKLSADLQGAMDSHAQALQDLNNEHHEKHALNSEALENGLNSVLENAHGKLQDELTQLRHGGAGSLKELSRILADVTEQVDKIDQAVETEHNLRMEVEKKLDSMCEDLRQEVAVSLEESHSALKLEMAEIGGNQDQIKEAMADASAALKDEWMAAHGQLKGELDAHRKENDAKHKGHADAMSAMNDEHLEKHASNAAALEEGIQNVLGGSHAQLQKDLKMLQSGGAGSLKELSKVVADVTKQVDNIDQAVQQEHDLRLAVEEKLDKMFGDQDKTISDLKKDMKVALNEAHAALKVEIAEHGKNAQEIQAAMEEANAALKDEVNLAHGSLKKELGSLSKENAAQHKSHQETMRSINDAHHEIHAQNAEKLESGLKDVLSGAHAKLQDELKLLKSGGAGSLKDLSKILADVTQQVDTIDQAVNQEHELRMAVETRFETYMNEQETVLEKLEKKLKVDFDTKTRDLSDAMNAMNNEHHEKHAANAAALEESIDNVLMGSHAKLQDDLKKLQSGGVGSLKDLSKILADVTKQVDKIDQAVEKEHELRMKVEDKLDSMFNDQNKTVNDLKKDMQVALKESHAALKLELADHGKNSEDIKAAMAEAHAALKDEVNLAHGSLKNELGSLAKEQEKKHKAHQDAMAAVNDKHHEIHAQNSEKLENGLKDVLSSAHGKLQEELKILKSGGAGSIKDLSKILADVTQQVDNIDRAVNQEHELRMAVEKKLDKMFNDSNAQIESLQKDIQTALHESHAALKLELAEHSKNAGEMKAAMADAHAALAEEMSSHKENFANHGTVSAQKMADMEAQLKADLARLANDHQENLKNLHDEHSGKHEEHAQNRVELEQGLHSTLANTHSKLQAELRELQSGHGNTIDGMRTILADVTTQVDTLTQTVDKEHDLRMAVEGRVDNMIQELRAENEAAMREAHAALRLEMGMLSKDAGEMKAAMAEAHKALKAEHGAVTGDLADKLDSHGKAHALSLQEMERQLRMDLSRSNGDLDMRHKDMKDQFSKHAAGVNSLDQRIALLEQSSTDKHRDAFKELQTAHGKINELVGSLQSHKSKLDMNQSSTEERLGYIERALKDKGDSHNALQSQFRGEALAREKTLTSVETRLSKMETYFTEITDRSAKELEGVSARYRELQSKFDQTRALSENNKNLVEQRLAYLDRAMLDTSDSHAQALSAFHNEHGKEIAHLLQAERIAREQQEKTFLDYIQDARQQKDALEATVQEQLRLERVAREVQSQQLRDAITHQHNFVGNAEYTDILLQERSSREAAERALERRLESFERAISMERNERAQDMQRIWDAFDGHTHEAMSPIVREMPQPVKVVQSPRIAPTTVIETVGTELPRTSLPIAERIVMPETTPLTTRSVPATGTISPLAPIMTTGLQRMTSIGTTRLA